MPLPPRPANHPAHSALHQLASAPCQPLPPPKGKLKVQKQRHAHLLALRQLVLRALKVKVHKEAVQEVGDGVAVLIRLLRDKMETGIVNGLLNSSKTTGRAVQEVGGGVAVLVRLLRRGGKEVGEGSADGCTPL